MDGRTGWLWGSLPTLVILWFYLLSLLSFSSMLSIENCIDVISAICFVYTSGLLSVQIFCLWEIETFKMRLDRSSEQPDLAVGVPVHCRWVGLDDLEGTPPAQMILWAPHLQGWGEISQVSTYEPTLETVYSTSGRSHFFLWKYPTCSTGSLLQGLGRPDWHAKWLKFRNCL